MPARKPLSILLILCIAIMSTSCINIVEKLFFKKDGSGSYSMTISVPEDSGTFGSGLPKSTKNSETELTSDFIKKLERVEQRFARIDGISNFDIHVNRETFSTGIRFDFTDLDALNEALYLYYEQSLRGEPLEHDKVFFEMKGKKTIIRKNRDILSTFLSKTFLDKNGGSLKALLLMKDPQAESTIEFEGTIKEHSNSDYKVVDKHSLYWKKYLYTKRHEDKEIGLSVRVK